MKIRCVHCGATRQEVRIWALLRIYPTDEVVCCLKGKP